MQQTRTAGLPVGERGIAHSFKGRLVGREEADDEDPGAISVSD